MQSPSPISLPAPFSSILWRPTAALAGVNATITLSWIIYRVHLAGLLTQAGFSKALAPTLLLIETILAIGIEPWAGSTSDRIFQRLGSRFRIIWIGAGLTALLFLLLPGIANRLQPNAAANSWLIALLIFWAIAISMFRSPALALLGLYAAPKQLPAAASWITLAGALASAATPLASPWLLSLGAGPTFVAAGVLVIGTVSLLKVTQPTDIAPSNIPAPALQSHGLVRIVGLGFTVTLVLRLALDLFPKMLKAANLQPPLFMGAIFISLAVGALIAGWLATHQGNIKVMQLGLALTAVALSLMLIPAMPIGAGLIAIAFGVAFSFILNGTLPFVLNALVPENLGLGVGLFFAGVATANSLHSGLLSQPVLPPSWIVGLGLIALVAAGFCLTPKPRTAA
jgi:Major Facilitator Superfamily